MHYKIFFYSTAPRIIPEILVQENARSPSPPNGPGPSGEGRVGTAYPDYRRSKF
jgi:hypothetical protein